MECAFELSKCARQLKNIVSDTNELDGFNMIKSQDQSKLQILVNNSKGNVERIKRNPSPKKKQNKSFTTLTSDQKTLSTAKKPSIKVLYTNADQLTAMKRIRASI